MSLDTPDDEVNRLSKEHGLDTMDTRVQCNHNIDGNGEADLCAKS